MGENDEKETAGADEPPASPVLLGGVDLGALLELSKQLAEAPAPATALQVLLESGQLEDYFRLMRERAQSVARGLEAQSALATMAPAPPAPPRPPARLIPESALAETRRAAPAPVPGETTLADFFQTVTQSIVDAQRGLDTQSLAYARELKGTPLAPVHFSLPNVHAEVKMGFNVSDPANLMVRLFGKPEDTTNYGESTVSFDVAASAPPPGVEFASPIPMFLVVEPERGRVLAEAGVPEAQRTSAVLIKNPANAKLAVANTLYLALAPHDGVVTMYRMIRDNPAQGFDIGQADAVKILSDLATALNAWLDSVKIPE